MPSLSPEFRIEQFGAIEPASGGHVIAIFFQTTSGENVKLHVPHEALPNFFTSSSLQARMRPGKDWRDRP